MDTDEGMIYVNAEGRKATGWQTIEGKRYYFDENGIRQSGTIDIDGERYTLDEDGVLQTGWSYDDAGNARYRDEHGMFLRDTALEIDGINYIFDEEAVAQWGWIRKVVVHDDITLVENLIAAGYKDLEAAKYLVGSIEADAVDLHLTDREIERIKLGDMILFEHPIDDEQVAMLVSGINLPVDSPGDTTFTLGTSYQTMTDNLISSKKDAAQQLEVVRTEVYTRTDEIRQSVTEFEIEVNQNLDGISSSVTETQTQITTTTENIYDALGQLQETIVTDEALEEVKQLLISQWSDELELRFTSVLNIIDQTNGTIEENQRLLEQYIRFEGARIELGRSDSVIKAVLQNDRLSFVESGQEVAYISNRTLHIKDAQIEQTLRFGNADSGYYVWSIGENSTYELTYTGP